MPKTKRTAASLLLLALGSWGVAKVAQRRYVNTAAFPVQPERITLEFASEKPPYSPANRHKGVDVAPYPGSFGAPVFAPVSGRVIDAGDSGRGYGLWVVIEEKLGWQLLARDLDGAKLAVPAGTALYWLLTHHDTVTVKKGDLVKSGQQVATVGSSGYSFGPHVHVELRAGGFRSGYRVLNPLDYLDKRIGGLAARVQWSNG